MEISKPKINDLSRPMAGAPNTVTFGNGIRFVKVISRKFICPKCNNFCGELIPVINKEVRVWMKRHKKNLSCPELQARVFCYSGCHDHPDWGWKHFDWSKTQAINSVVEWPKEWTAKDIRANELKAREADKQFKKDGPQ